MTARTQSVARPIPYSLLGAALAVAMFGSLLSQIMSQLPQPLSGGSSLAGGSPPMEHDDVAPQSEGSGKTYAPDAVLVAFQSGLTDTQKLAIVRSYGLEVDQVVRSPYFARLIIPDEQRMMGITVESTIEALSRDTRFRYAETDNAIYPEEFPNDSQFSQQYALHNTGQTGGTVDADVDAPEAWDLIPNGATPIVVADCDTGFEIAHADLAGNIWVNPNEIAGNGIDDDANGFIDDVSGWDFVDGNNNVDPAGAGDHGQHTAGIIGMVQNNGIGGCGVGQSIRVMPIRMYNGQSTWLSALASGVDYAWRNGAKVISVSYNIDGYNQTLLDAIGRAKAADVIYCNSAGNNTQNIDGLRGAIRAIHSNAVFVASTDHNDALSSFSNFGQTVDFATPGSNIYSTILAGTWGLKSGTSMACPLGAGILAMVRLMNPGMTAQQAIAHVRNTSEPKPTLAVNLGGRANLNRALTPPDTVPPSNPTGLEVCYRSSTSLKFKFIASGDDGAVGAASSYDARISSSPITIANFNSAQQLSPVNGGVASGTMMEGSTAGLIPGSTVYLALRARDDFENVSAGITTFGPVTMAGSIWQDNASGTAQFVGAPWGVATVDGSAAYVDSPAGTYGNSIDVSATMPGTVAVSGASILNFRAKIDTEAGYDVFFVEASTNGGTSWTKVFQSHGNNGGWKQYAVSLAPFAGQSVKLRLRLTTDGSVVRDGVAVDDLSIVNAATLVSDDSEGAVNFSAQAPWARTNERANSPSLSYTDSPGVNYGASVNTSLLGTVNYDTSTVGNPVVGFATWMRIARLDVLNINASTNSGSSWSGAGALFGLEGAWSQYSAPLPSAPNVRFGFQLVTNASTQDMGIHLDDFKIVGEPYRSDVTGTVILEDYSGTFAGRNPSLSLLQTGTSTVLQSGALSASAFSVSTTLTQAVDVLIDADQFLTRRITNVLPCYAMAPISVSLINGDVDNDNEIGPGDFGALSAAFGSVDGDSNWNAAADLDGDGEVGPSDFGILSANFGETGE